MIVDGSAVYQELGGPKKMNQDKVGGEGRRGVKDGWGRRERKSDKEMREER